MALRSKAAIVRKKNELIERCNLEASLNGPMKRIPGKSKASESARFAASLANGHAARVLEWVLMEDEKDAKRRERDGDYE